MGIEYNSFSFTLFAHRLLLASTPGVILLEMGALTEHDSVSDRRSFTTRVDYKIQYSLELSLCKEREQASWPPSLFLIPINNPQAPPRIKQYPYKRRFLSHHQILRA